MTRLRTARERPGRSAGKLAHSAHVFVLDACASNRGRWFPGKWLSTILKPSSRSGWC